MGSSRLCQLWIVLRQASHPVQTTLLALEADEDILQILLHLLVSVWKAQGSDSSTDYAKCVPNTSPLARTRDRTCSTSRSRILWPEDSSTLVYRK